MKARSIHLRLMLLAMICASAVSARAQTSNADFQQAVAAYQQSPNDVNNAEKVIRMAAAMDQLPPIPEEARRHFVRGTTLFKDAKTPDDYEQVGGEFSQAVHLAPWWPEARYNWALVQEAAGVYDWAIKNLKLYLLFKLPDADARAAQDKIYAIEAKQEKAQKTKEEENSPQAVAARQQQSFDDLLRKIDGRRYTYQKGPEYPRFVLEIKGRTIVSGFVDIFGRYSDSGRKEIQGRVTSFSESWNSNGSPLTDEGTFTISEDGGTIEYHLRRSGAINSDDDTVYRWQR